MKILIILVSIILLAGCKNLSKNKNIKIIVISKFTPDTSNIFITGNHELLGNWIPDMVKLTNQYNHVWQITLSIPLNNELSFKFTRGSWVTEALDANGGVPSNHTCIVKNDTTIEFRIERWKDSFISMNSRKITGDYEFHQKLSYPGLKSRDIIVWLPLGYKKNSKERYPVLYMNDGQNLFDPNTSFQGIDWQVDETADSLIKNHKINPILIVGIYNSSDRSKEYSDSPLGMKYAEFLIKKLKPFIDENYRTLPDAENTAIAGSSLGGLISFIMVWEYPHIFSKAICLSPAFKIDEIDYVNKVQQYSGPKKNIKIYIYNGGLDLEERLRPGIDEMLESLKEQGYFPDKDFVWFNDETASHNETAWAKHFWQPLKFFYKKR